MTSTQSMRTNSGGLNLGESHCEMISSDEFSDLELEEEGGSQRKVKTLRLESDFYGLFSLKFRVTEGTLISEGEIAEDFGAFGSVIDIWGAGFVDKELKSFDSEVFVRFEVKSEAVEAWLGLKEKYRELTPAISDVLPDNFGLYTITFVNKVSVPSEQIHHEFSQFGKIVKLYGELDRRGGRVGVAYRVKEDAIEAFLRKCERWYCDMRFTLPHCETDYTGYYCLRFENIGAQRLRVTEETVREEFGKFGEVVDVRGAGLFEARSTEVYVRFREKSSAQHALTSLNGRYAGLCIAPATRLRCDQDGLFVVTFINKSNASQTDIFEKFKTFGAVRSVSGVFNTDLGRVFVAMQEADVATAAIRGCMGDKDFHLQLAKGTRPWRVRTYGVGLHPAVKADSLPPGDFKTNPARPTFQRNPSSYKQTKPSSSGRVFPSLDERVENFKDFKYERVNHLKNFLGDERLVNHGDMVATSHQQEEGQIKKRYAQELSKKAGDEEYSKGRVRSVKIVKDAKSRSKSLGRTAVPREKNSFLSTKLSPVCSVMQTLKRKSDGEEGGDLEVNKKRRIEIIGDPRRRKREEEKLQEEEKVRAVREGLMMKSPLPLKKRVVLSPTSDAVRDEARFYQYRREKEQKLEQEDKENRPNHMGKNKEVEDGEWDGEEEEKSSPRSWDFRNRSTLTEEVQ